MRALVAVSLVLAVAYADPQVALTYPLGMGAGVWPYGHHTPLTYGLHTPLTYAVPSSGVVLPGSVPLVYPRIGKSVEVVKPVEETPEVKQAKEVFMSEWQKAAHAAAVTPDVSVRRRRDVSPLVVSTGYSGIPSPVYGGAYGGVYSGLYKSPLLASTGYPLYTHMPATIF